MQARRVVRPRAELVAALCRVSLRVHNDADVQMIGAALGIGVVDEFGDYPSRQSFKTPKKMAVVLTLHRAR